MALKALMLRKKIDNKKKELAKLTEKADELNKREADLEKSIDEATTEEEQQTVEEAVAEFENEKKENEDAKAELETEIAGLESELAETEAAQEAPAAEPEARTAPVEQKEERGGNYTMNKRNLFANMSAQERDAMFQRENVQAWIAEVRSAIKEKRAIQNVGLTIPEEFLGVLKQNIENYSKLYKHVNVRSLSGDGRLVVMGSLPEAIWTDCCANLNELDLKFNDEEFGCWKVGGFYAICNANLEDSDVDLANEALVAIGQAIGLAVDKAIIYGTGTRMPLGIVTRLCQTSKPAGYSSTARDWEDLHTSNIKAINSSGMTAAQLFAAIVTDFGAAKGKYSRGEKTWVMNESTYTELVSAAVGLNAAGAIAAGIGGTMPVIGGDIVVLDFIKDDNIIGGYGDLYLLAERAGTEISTSEHVRFLADETVIKGTARYDGKPVIAEGFVVISLQNTAVSATAVTFAADEANTANGIVLNKAAVSVTVATGTTHTAKLIASTLPEGQAVTYTCADTSKATVTSAGVVTGVATGTTTVTAASGNAQAFCTVTVS